MANHALHETPPTYLVLICIHQLVVMGLVIADLDNGDAPLVLSIIHNATKEFWVGVHLCKPVLHEINGFHECINPTSMITEEDMQACLGHLGAAWAERVNSFLPGNVCVSRSYSHHLLPVYTPRSETYAEYAIGWSVYIPNPLCRRYAHIGCQVYERSFLQFAY